MLAYLYLSSYYLFSLSKFFVYHPQFLPVLIPFTRLLDILYFSDKYLFVSLLNNISLAFSSFILDFTCFVPRAVTFKLFSSLCFLFSSSVHHSKFSVMLSFVSQFI